MTEEGKTDSGFLKRWSRRKQQVAETDSVASHAGDTDSSPDNIVAMAAEDTDRAEIAAQSVELEQHEVAEEVLTDADMPDLNTLDKNSDYSPFLSEGVSKELRNLALKKLFFSGKFALRDGLDDYDDDFTRFEPLGNTVTSDMKFHQRRKERERLARLEEEERLQQEGDDKQAEHEEPAAESDVPEASEQIESETDHPEQESDKESDSEQDIESVNVPVIASVDDKSQDSTVVSAGSRKLRRIPQSTPNPAEGDPV